MSVPEKIYPGKRLRFEAVFERGPGEGFDVNPSTVTLTLTPPNNATPVVLSGVEVDVTFDSVTKITAIARYTIPRSAQSSGTWNAGWLVTGNLETAHDQKFYVEHSLK